MDSLFSQAEGGVSERASEKHVTVARGTLDGKRVIIVGDGEWRSSGVVQ
jgi:hypothetical protein